MADFRERPDAPKDVVDYWQVRSKNMVTSFDYRDVWAGEHVQGFTVAKAMRHDVQVALHKAVGKAINDGMPFKQFASELEPKLQKLGWWGKGLVEDPKTGDMVLSQLGSPRRLKTIYQSNMRSARAAGFWLRAQRTKRALPFLVYRLGPSEVHRPHHVAQEGKVYPIDHQYWQHWLGPNGWGCKCWAQQVSRAEAESLGGVSAEPDLKLKPYKNKRTGETVQVPEGIDPGWHSNPGIAHLNFINSGRKLNQSLKAASKIGAKLDDAISRRGKIAAGFLTTPALQNVFARAKEFPTLSANQKTDIRSLVAPVAILGDAKAKHIGANIPVVGLSVETLSKQLSKNEMGRLDFSKLQRLIEDGLMKSDKRELHWIIAGQIDGAWYRAVLKRTADGNEIYLQSLRREKAKRIAEEFDF